jgi:pilus assembly protein CpaB
VKLVLASRDLDLGAILRERDIALTDWPGNVPVPAGASSLILDFVGRGVVAKIYANEPILESRLAPKGAGGGFASAIPPGMRAVAVPVNQVVGVARFILPGMHVDLLISGTPSSGTGGPATQTRTLLENIEVLSSGQDFKKDVEGKPVAVEVVNLLLTPRQAEQLVRASFQNTISVVLRNPLDRSKNSRRRPALAPGTSRHALLCRGLPLQRHRRPEAEPEPPGPCVPLSQVKEAI